MGIFNLRYYIRKKFVEIAAILRIWNANQSLILHRYERLSKMMPKKVFFMVMTLSMMSQGGLKVALCINVS